MKLTLSIRSGCQRSERALAVVEALAREAGLELEVFEDDRATVPPDQLPCLFIGGEQYEGPLTEPALRERLGMPARSRAPVPRSNRGVKLGALAGALLVVALVGFEFWRTFPGSVSLLELGVEPLQGPAPAFVLKDEEGKAVRLEDLRGKTVLLNFWATWCEPCKQEMPQMALLAQHLAGEDFAVVAASVDESWQTVGDYLGGAFGPQGPPFQVLHDPGARWSEAFGTYKYPESYVIGKDGTLRARFVGPRAWMQPEIVRYFKALLGREPGGTGAGAPAG